MDGRGFARSIDTGLTWTSIHIDTSQSLVNDIATRGAGEVFVATSHGIFYSPDNGTTWQKRNVGLLDSAMMSIVVSRTGELFTGSDSGRVFHSTNNGSSWQLFSDGLEATTINDLTLDSIGYLYAATDSGVFRTSKKITALAEGRKVEPVVFSLSQNFPNPFNPSTSIPFSVANAGWVNLSIFNLLGQQVAVLVNEVKYPGKYVVSWKPDAIPAGAYFYQIRSGIHTSTKQMMYVK